MSKGAIRQIIAASIIGLGSFSMAYMLVWPSYTLKIFQSNQSPLVGNFTSGHENLIGSVPMLGSMVGTIIGGILSDSIGRKKGEILSGLILVLSASLLCTAKSTTLLIIARSFLGVGSGIHGSIYSIYLAEFSSPSIRGTLMAIVGFSYCFGVLISYVTGWLCSYNVNNYIFLSVNVAFVVLICWLKESPIYLLRNGHDKVCREFKEALKSLKYYRGTTVTSQEILDKLTEIKKLVKLPQEISLKENVHDDLEKEKLRQTDATNTEATKTSVWKALEKPTFSLEDKPFSSSVSSKSTMRALITMLSLLIIAISMGMIAVQTYAGVLFTRAVPNLSSDLCSIALAIANIIGSCLPLFFSEYIGRRVLMMTSAALVSGCLITLGVLVRWPVAPDWMIPVMILMYCFCYQLGVGSVPYVLCAESFLPEVSTLCIVICVSVVWVTNFVNLAVFGTIVSLLGLHGTFFAYSIIAGSAVVLTYLIVPETTGLSTEAIQQKFSKGFLQVDVQIRKKNYTRE